jgi:NADPH:quinone reductase
MIAGHRWVAADFGGPEVLRQVEVDVPDPAEGQVTIDVRACGMNPADAKHIAPGQSPSLLPLTLGFEVSGVVSVAGPGTTLSVGDEVAAQVSGGYATAITVRACDVQPKPPPLTFPEAAGLLLAGTTAAELLHVSQAEPGGTVLLHGGAGAVGLSVLQQARRAGVRVIATASPANFELVRKFGGVPVEYGPGLLERVRAAAPESVAAALDTVGSREAAEVSLALVKDRSRVVTIADATSAKAGGYVFIGASNPASGPFRARAQPRVIAMAAAGDLVVPMAATFPFDDAPAAFELLTSQHAPGKIALVRD